MVGGLCCRKGTPGSTCSPRRRTPPATLQNKLHAQFRLVSAGLQDLGHGALTSPGCIFTHPATTLCKQPPVREPTRHWLGSGFSSAPASPVTSIPPLWNSTQPARLSSSVAFPAKTPFDTSGQSELISAQKLPLKPTSSHCPYLPLPIRHWSPPTPPQLLEGRGYTASLVTPAQSLCTEPGYHGPCAWQVCTPEPG